MQPARNTVDPPDTGAPSHAAAPPNAIDPPDTGAPSYPLCTPRLQFEFAAGRNEPTKIASEMLQTLLDLAFDHPEYKIIVEGYASQDGNPMWNLKLSHDRAAAVRRVLVRHGIASSRIVLQAFGEYRPSLEGRDDRRAVAHIGGIPACKGVLTP